MTDTSRFYVLDKARRPVPVDERTWREWFIVAGDRRRVGDTIIRNVRIRTVFTGLMLLPTDGPPLLFETMVFGGPLTGARARYATWDEAAAGHKEMCKQVSQRVGAKRTKEGEQRTSVEREWTGRHWK